MRLIFLESNCLNGVKRLLIYATIENERRKTMAITTLLEYTGMSLVAGYYNAYAVRR